MNILSSKFAWFFVIALQSVIWFWVKDDPFFGDAIASTSQATNHIYKSNLATIFYPLNADPAHPTLYSYLLAVVWKIVGRTLWVSHLYSCGWAVFLIYAFRKVASQFLTASSVNMATILVLAFPTYLAQTAMMLNTAALMTFFLIAVYGVLINNRRIMCIASVFMCATHLQAPFLLFSLCCFDWYRTVFLLKQYTLIQWLFNRWMYYTIPILIFATWLFVHYQHTGWLVVSPQYNDVKELNTPLEYTKAMLLIMWRLLDYGMLSFYVVLVYVFLKQRQFRKEYIQLLILIVPCCLAMAIFLSNTIGHRYFMAFGMLSVLFAVFGIQQLRLSVQKVLYIVLFISLLIGNFLFYPGKIIGDATLAYRGFFDISNRIKQEYSNTIFYSHAPIANPSQITHLQLQGLLCERINEMVLDSVPVIIQSNVNAEFTQAEIDHLTQYWFGKSYESGAVYATVFFNPKFYKQTEPSCFRQPSTIENWMIALKMKLK